MGRRVERRQLQAYSCARIQKIIVKRLVQKTYFASDCQKFKLGLRNFTGGRVDLFPSDGAQVRGTAVGTVTLWTEAGSC